MELVEEIENNEKKLYNNIKNKIFVKSKQDLRNYPLKNKEILDISSKTGYGINKLLNKIINILISKNQNEIPIISRERQLLKVKKCLNHLKSFNLKKNIEKNFESFKGEKYSEQVVLTENSPCSKIDDSMLSEDELKKKSLTFFSYNAPLFAKNEDDDNSADSCDSL